MSFACRSARRPGRLAALLLPALLVLGLPPVARAQALRSSDELQTRIAQTLERQGLQDGFWGIKITEVDSGISLYQRNATKRFVPASNVKLFTAAAVMEQLKPDYRYVTRLYADGPIQRNVLRGDLLVRGSGDPTIGGHEQRDDRLQIFRAWADSLKAAGIRSVQGNVIGDDNVHSDVPLGEGWSWDDLPYRYAAEFGGLVFGENTIELTARGQRPGRRAEITWTPLNTDYVRVINRSRSVRRGGDEEYRRPPGTNTIYVESRIPTDHVHKEVLAVSNPTRYFAHVLIEVLENEGIAVSGRAIDIDQATDEPSYDAPSTRVLARYVSAPMVQIISTMLEESQNLYAEQLLRTLGVERPVKNEDAEPGTTDMGLKAAERTFTRAGIETRRLDLSDGSGLSRYNMATPAMTIKLLRYMRRHDDASVRRAFYLALSTGGREGTLEYRFRHGPALGNVRAKTGTLSSVSALSGYVTTAGGTPLAFVIWANHFSAETSVAREGQDRIVQALAGARF